jgi:hypothetical protein
MIATWSATIMPMGYTKAFAPNARNRTPPKWQILAIASLTHKLTNDPRLAAVIDKMVNMKKVGTH